MITVNRHSALCARNPMLRALLHRHKTAGARKASLLSVRLRFLILHLCFYLELTSLLYLIIICFVVVIFIDDKCFFILPNVTSQQNARENCRSLGIANGLTPDESKRFYLASIADSFENGTY